MAACKVARAARKYYTRRLMFFARKQLSIHKLCKTDDSVMKAFSEMGPSVTDTIITALTKISTSQGAMDNRLNEISKKIGERNTTLTNQFNYFQKNQTQQPQRSSFSQNRGQNSNSFRGIFRGNFGGRFRGNTRGFGGPRPNYQRFQCQNQNQISYTPRQQSYQISPQQNSNSFSQPQSSSFQPQNPNLQNQKFENQNSQPQNSNLQPQPWFEVFTPDPNYMPYTQKTQITCHKCGYPKHLATNCTIRKNPPRRGAQNPFNQNPKSITQHKNQKPRHVKKVQWQKPDTCNEFIHLDPPEMCAVLPLEGKNLSYVRLKFSSQIKRRPLIDTGSCAIALPESLFNDINLTNPKSFTLQKPFFDSVRIASGQRVSVDKQTKLLFQIKLHYFQDSFLILPTMNSVNLGNLFFKKHIITIDPKNNLLQLPDLTVQLN